MTTLLSHKQYQKLRFMIAHEVGHLVSEHSLINTKRNLQIDFLMPDEKVKELFCLNNAFRKRRQEAATDQWAVNALNSKEGALAYFTDTITQSNSICLIADPHDAHPSCQYRLDCIRYDHIELPWVNWEVS